MGCGHPDWWSSTISVERAEETGQEIWHSRKTRLVAGDSDGELNFGSVGAHALIYLTSIYISIDFPCLGKFKISTESGGTIEGYFDTSIVIPLSPPGFHLFEAGDTVYVLLTNLDSDAHTFYVNLFGYEIDLLP